MAAKIYKIIQNSILVSILMVIVAFFMTVIVFDTNPYVVVSGSMEPNVPVGSICLVNCQDREPDVDDIIAYRAGDTIITHRVVEETDQGYVTKGDANNATDPGVVKQKQIFGVCSLVIPKVGYVVMFLRTLKGIVLTITGVICFGLLGKLIENRKE